MKKRGRDRKDLRRKGEDKKSRMSKKDFRLREKLLRKKLKHKERSLFRDKFKK